MTKAEIVDAAFKVWGRNFYQKTSLSQLAKELGVSKPALYRHFRNKEALNSAMNERFIEDFSNAIRGDFEQALKTTDADEGLLIIIGSIAGFFARNVYIFIFSLVNIYDRKIDGSIMSQRLNDRGVNMAVIQLVIEKKYDGSPSILMLIFTTLTFFMSFFHISVDSIKNEPSGGQIQNIILRIFEIVKNGLKFPVEETKLDFEKLEKQVDASIQNVKPDPIFKAVAEAVAEAGPWDTSMEMVAKRMGFSKSSLYGHFKNKKDMLQRFFMGEFMRIIEFAHKGIDLSEKAAEKLYLGTYSISVYLKLHSEILAAMDRIRTRKLNLGKPEKQTNFFTLFEDVEIASLRDAEDKNRQAVSHWIIFLIISILMRRYTAEENMGNDTNNDIRQLYKFISLGLGGFIK